uniref:Uncharacterized protein n=1 Tax=Amphimedon queenslandica TaxID=400682 RepID=A0A1X7UDE9_AMPQE
MELQKVKTPKKQIIRRLDILRRQATKRMIYVAMVMHSLLAPLPRRPKACWTVMRSSHWWECIVLQSFTDEDWVENFRISKPTFMFLCQHLKENIEWRILT